MKNKEPLRIFIIFYVGIGILCIGLLYHRQIINHIKANPKVFFSNRSALRGNIFFTNKFGQHPIAASSVFVSSRLIVNSRRVTDIDETYSIIQTIFPEVDEKSFIKKIQKANDPYIVIKKSLTDKEIEKFEKLSGIYNTRGIHIEKSEKRQYPYHSRAANVIGFVGYDEKTESYNGRYGLEAYYQSDLENNKSEESIGIVTSIEPNVQDFLEKKIEKIKTDWESDLVGGVIMDPNTGKIVASAVVPTFDPNLFEKEENIAVYKNPIVENVYEFGSIMKPITVAIGIDSNSVEIDDTYDDKGFAFVDGRRISNFDEEGRGPNTSIQTILSDSLNTGIVFLLEKIGNKIFSGYLDAFALEEPTGIDLPRENGGLVGNLKKSRRVGFVTAGYGQGIAITPISMIRILSTLANDGVAATPSVVSHQKKNNEFYEIIEENINKRGKRIFKKETTDEVTKMLVKSYDEVLYSGRLRNPRYQIAVKTGTALMVDPNTRKYSKDKFLHSFFGYFPASRPEYIVLLFSVGVDSDYFASETLTVPFSEISEYIIDYYDLLPDR